MHNYSKLIGKPILITALIACLIINTAFFIDGNTDVLGVSSLNSKTYRLEVNKKRDICTAYKWDSDLNKYVPIRAMRVSCGRKGKYTTTPSGTFKIKKKWKWELLYGGSYGRYAMQFYKDYLFHTVGYIKKNNKSSIITAFYKQLGTNASAGCIRMQFIDEKWIYDNCPSGTVVKIYSSKKIGQLGMPGIAKLNSSKKYDWDPTDPDANKKIYNTQSPKIMIDGSSNKKISKTQKTYELINSNVKAVDTRTKQDLSDCIKYKVEWRNSNDGEWLDVTHDTAYVLNDELNTSNIGYYRITYSCYYKYCSKNTGTKTIYLSTNQ